jgi:hypothetical protein
VRKLWDLPIMSNPYGRAIKESVPQMDIFSALPLLCQPSTEVLENLVQSDDNDDTKRSVKGISRNKG